MMQAPGDESGGKKCRKGAQACPRNVRRMKSNDGRKRKDVANSMVNSIHSQHTAFEIFSAPVAASRHSSLLSR